MGRKNAIKVGAALFWAALIFIFYRKTQEAGYDSLGLLREIYRFVINDSFGPLVYILIYAIRPLIFFPAALLTLLSGALFGLWWGIVYTIVGENLSAALAYWVGRLLGRDLLEGQQMAFMIRWRERLANQHFMAVLTMRLIYLPFDIVNYACGALGVRWRSYALATFIGILPGLVTFVSFGASLNIKIFTESSSKLQIQDFLDAKQIAISILLFLASLVIARTVRTKQKNLL